MSPDAVEDMLYTPAEHDGWLTDGGERQCGATIRSGLAFGYRPGDLDVKRR